MKLITTFCMQGEAFICVDHSVSKPLSDLQVLRWHAISLIQMSQHLKQSSVALATRQHCMALM